MASPHQSAAVVDDLPWPELGNVSRGATRGNQGQKGVLGPSDVEGRCVLQLRVQPGVLSVKLNRQASLWYRTLDNEVNRALKLTKSYWRKARRRQDYDARADQDHMELHEWLQQLKDKTMSHLELLMQKGDITGPPYIMGDDLELTFLRKFMERQTRGVPHNPRLRNPIFNAENQMSRQSIESTSPDSTDAVMSQSIIAQRNSISPTLNNTQLVSQEASTSKHELLAARSALQRAQQETHEAFLRYTACLEAEQQARQTVAAAEKRRDDLVALLISKNHVSMAVSNSRQSPEEDEDSRQDPTRYHADALQSLSEVALRSQHIRVNPPENTNNMWQSAPTNGPLMYSNHAAAAPQQQMPSSRKHTRSWEDNTQDVYTRLYDI